MADPPADAENVSGNGQHVLGLTGGQKAGQAALTINHRQLPVVRGTDGVLAVTFRTLCEDARSQPRLYCAIENLSHPFLYEVPVLTTENEKCGRGVFWRWWMSFGERKVN